MKASKSIGLSAVFLILSLFACGKHNDQATDGEHHNDKALVWVEGPAGKLCAYTSGSSDKTPVVFVHSLAGQWQQWYAQIDHLSAARQVIAFDMRGHGESVRGAEIPYGMDEAVADLDAVVNHFELATFLLVGHSFGGSVVAAYIGKHPEKVAGAVFADAAGDLSEVNRADYQQFMETLGTEAYHDIMLQYWQQILENAHEDVKARVISAMQATQKEAVIAALRSLPAFDVKSALAGFNRPMLAITTDKAGDGTGMHEAVTMPHEIIANTSHWLHMDNPDRFNEILDTFLSQQDL